MAFTIENSETCTLAREPAELTSETMTGTITIALRERMEREQRARDKDALFWDIHAIGKRCTALMGSRPSAVEHGNFRHHERGLPK